MTETSRDDLVWWAVGASVPIPSGFRIGPDRCARVLAVLALHANVDGYAWPSAETIAATIPGLHRRDVRDALAVLENGGFISRVPDPPVKRRSVTWLLHAVPRARQVAGIPATSDIDNLAGIPATNERADLAGELAGNLAGEVAGNLAGIPATNRREEKRTPIAHARAHEAGGSQWAGEECDVRRDPRGPHELDADGLACVHCQARNPAVSDIERDAIGARRRLTALHRERALPIGLDELVQHAALLGDGDLLAGYRIVERVTERSLAGTHDPAAALRSRLRPDRARRVQAA